MHLAAAFGDLLMAFPTVDVWIAGAWGALAQNLATTFVTSIWQGTLIACGLAICLRVGPRISAAHRFLVWAAGLVVVSILPFLPLLAHVAGTVSSGAVSDGAFGGSVKPWIQLDIRWSLAIAGLWIAASVLQAAWLVIHSIRLRHVWKAAVPVAIDDRVSSLLAQRKTRGRKPVEICTTTMLQQPSVIGFFAPRILIPDWLLKRLTPGELEQIVLHETEHLRRGDDWTNLLQKMCLIVFPVNPALWWIESRLCREREMACDEGVVKVTCAPRAYAACLTSLAERGLERRADALSLGAWQKRAELVVRVHGILARKRALTGWASWATLGTMGCGLILGSVGMAHSPKLVAFAPRQQAEMERAISQSRMREAAFELVPASYREGHGKQQTEGAHGFYSMNATARMPAPRQEKGASPARQPVRKTVTLAGKSSGIKPASGSARPELVRTRQSAAHEAIASEQELVVFTAWEHVQTSGGVVSDYATQETGDLVVDRADANSANAVRDSGSAKGYSTNQITVTRLIFRIFAVTPLSTQPPAEIVRSSWFTLQL